MWHQGWDEIFSQNQWGKHPSLEVIRYVARQFSNTDKKQVRLLEIGCGTGANVIALANDGYDVYGIDGSEVAIGNLNQRLEHNRTSLNAVVGDAMAMDFDAGMFDCVIDCECLYCNSLEDSRKILREVKRVLKPGGKLLSITFMKISPLAGSYSSADFNNSLRQGCGPIRLMTKADINDLYCQEFNLQALDFSLRTDKDRQQIIGEWVVQCQKRD